MVTEVSQGATGRDRAPAQAMTHWADVFYLRAVGLCATPSNEANTHSHGKLYETEHKVHKTKAQRNGWLSLHVLQKRSELL